MKKSKNKFQYNKNRRKAWKKMQKKAHIGCKQVAEVWDERKSASENMKEMGLSLNINKVMPLRRTKNAIGPEESRPSEKPEEPEPSKKFVVKQLEEEANIPQPDRMKIAEPEVLYCIHFMDKYGDDYKAMARDPKNYYQDTPKQIKRKIEQFKRLPKQYNAYLESKKNSTEAMDT